MFPVSDNYHNAARAASRSVSARVTVNPDSILSEIPTGSTIPTVTAVGGVVLGADNLKRIVFKDTIAPSNELSIGSMCSNSVTVDFFMPSATLPLKGGRVFVEIGLETASGIEYCPIGLFYVSSVTFLDATQTNASVSLQAYDAASVLFSDEWESNLSFPAKLTDIITEIADKHGMEVDDLSAFDGRDYEVVYFAAMEKDVLGYAAGMIGKNAYITRDNKIGFKGYSSPSGFSEIGKDIQYMDSFAKTTMGDFVVQSLVSGTSDAPITAGSGQSITFYNPWMTQDALNAIFEGLNGMAYSPATIKWRGDPSVECGDLMTVADRNNTIYTVAVTEHEITVGLGMNAQLRSDGVSETQTVISQSPTDKKITLAYRQLEQAFQNATDLMKGNNGGYYHLTYDEQGFPNGWQIWDTAGEKPLTTTKMWIMNQSGLFFSADGGASVSRVAITMNGEINADAILTGTMSAERINVGGGTLGDFFRVGTTASGRVYVSIGAADAAVFLKQEADRVGFFPSLDEDAKAIAYISPTRFQVGNFAIQPRANGNLSIFRVAEG